MTSTDGWGGRKVQEARAYMRQLLPAPCGKCGGLVTGEQQWVIGHKIARNLRPDLMWETTNWQHEHRRCSNKSGQAAVIEKARREGAQGALFPLPDSLRKASPLPISLPDDDQIKPVTIRLELTWDEFTKNPPDHIKPLIELLADDPLASPPTAMTPVPITCTGTYGWQAIEWVERTLACKLRWWQKLFFVRILEHDSVGELLWRKALGSASRRAGKSHVMRGLALWRMAHRHLFGEVQLVMHFGSDLNVCREIQRGAWTWAKREWGAKSVTTANGKEAIENPDGDRWVTRAWEAVYGYDITMGLGDECWAVPTTVVDDGVDPAMLERSMPQLVLISTSHPRATDLMVDAITLALSAEADEETLLLLWAMLPQEDHTDPDVWRRVSPHWSRDREKTITNRYEAALHSPNPAKAMETFKAQYLNAAWFVPRSTTLKGDPVITTDDWQTLRADRTDGATLVSVALEQHWQTTYMGMVFRSPDGELLASVREFANLGAAADLLSDLGIRRVLAGATIAKHPDLVTAAPDRPALRATARKTPAAQAVQQFAQMLADKTFLHDGTLTKSVLDLRTVHGPDGSRVVSQAPAAGIKAVVWALEAAQAKSAATKRRIIVAS